jgi:penicillin amidase/acyl-homoserine-lactone acylase
MRYLKIGVLAFISLVVGAALFLIVADRLCQPAPPDPAALIAKAQQYDVHIERDTFGVPNVIGRRREVDVAFGFGFAHAEDDFATIQQVALAVRSTRRDRRKKGGCHGLSRPSVPRLGDRQCQIRN